MTNTAEAVQGTLTMTTLGQSVASTGGSTDTYEFAATSWYRNDGAAGLMLMGARYYEAQTGSFISRDTMLTEKPFAYCNDDPINGTDPTRRFIPHIWLSPMASPARILPGLDGTARWCSYDVPLIQRGASELTPPAAKRHLLVPIFFGLELI